MYSRGGPSMTCRIYSTIILFLFSMFFVAQSQAGSVTYTYDERGRLIKADYGGDDWISYGFDGAGNMETEIVKQFPLTVSQNGSGDGLVTSDIAGIDCGEDCQGLYPLGTTITLTAVPIGNSVFTGWSGVCSGTEPCQVEITGSPVDVSATFTRTRLVSIVLGGSGSGTVISDPPGIDCGDNCSALFVDGTELTISKIPDQGSYAEGGETSTSTVYWGTSSIYVNFQLIQHELAVSKVGTGSGTIVSTDGFVDCGSDCLESYNEGSEVTLVAVSESGSEFSGWSGGDCSGNGECLTTINADRSVTATFTKLNNTLSVFKSGNGAGSITSSPAGIDCGADCQEMYDIGTDITLSATPDPGSGFRGWFGAGCSGRSGDALLSRRAGQPSLCTLCQGADVRTRRQPGSIGFHQAGI